MPPPDPQPYVPEQGVDTSVPVQPAGYGAFQQVPATPPPPRNIVDYTVDTVLGMAQGAIQIPAAISGAASRVPGTSPEQQASVRDDQRYWNDMDYWLGRAKSKTGQAEDAAGGPDITKDPVHALVQGAAGIIPQAPLMMLGPFAPLAFGVQGVGDLANKIRAKIDDADHGELMKAPVYKQTFERTGDTEKAKEALYQSTNDLATNLIAGGGSAIGGGLLTHAIPKIGTKLLSEAMANKIVAGHNLTGRLGLGAAEGFGSGALMTGSSEYAQQQAEYEAGMGPPPDYGAIATHAAKSGAVLGAIGGASKGLWGTRPAAPLGTDVEATAQAQNDFQNMPVGPSVKPPPTPLTEMQRSDLGQPYPGQQVPGGPAAPHMPVPGEQPAPGYGDYEQRQTPPAGPAGPRPGIEEEAGDQTPGGPAPAAPKAQAGESYADYVKRVHGSTPEAMGPQAPSFHEWAEQRYQAEHPEYGPQVPTRLPTQGEPPAPLSTRARGPMTGADIHPPGTLGYLEHLKEQRGLYDDQIADRVRRLKVEADRRGLELTGDPEDDAEELSGHRDLMAEHQAIQAMERHLATLDDGITRERSNVIAANRAAKPRVPVTEGGRPFEAPPVVTPERPIPPRFPEVESPRFPRQGDFPPPEEEPPREPPPAEPREPPAGGGGGAEPPAEEKPSTVVGLHPPDLEPQLAEHDTPTLRAMLHEARLREQEAVDKWQRTHDSKDGDAAERAADLADLLEDEVNERARHPAAAERRRQEIVAEQRARGERHDDSIFGVRGEYVLSDLGITPHAAGRGGEERVLPEAANQAGREILRGSARQLERARERAREREQAKVEQRKIRDETTAELTPERGGRKGEVIIRKAEERAARRRRIEAEARGGEGEPVDVRGQRVPSMEARTERERRAAAMKEAQERRRVAAEREAGTNEAMRRVLETMAGTEAERQGERRRQLRLGRRLARKFKNIASYTGQLLLENIAKMRGQRPSVTPILERMADRRRAERVRVTDRQRRRDERNRHYEIREGYAKTALLGDENNLSIPDLTRLAIEGYTPQFAEGEWGTFTPRGKRGEKLLVQGVDPATLPLRRQLDLFRQFINETPHEHLRNVARQMRDDVQSRIEAGAEAYKQMREYLAAIGETPRIRLGINDRRGRGDWHRQFAALRQFKTAVDGIIDPGGSFDSARTPGQRDNAYYRLRQLITNHYEREMALRTGGIAEIDKADKAGLKAAKEQIANAKRGKLSAKERFYANQTEAIIDKALGEEEPSEAVQPERYGREGEPEIATSEEEDAFRATYEDMPNIIYRVQQALNVLLPRFGSDYVQDAQRKVVEDWLDEYTRRLGIDRDRQPGERPRTLEEYWNSLGENAERNRMMTQRFGTAFHAMPPEYKQLSIDYGTLITPRDVQDTTSARRIWERRQADRMARSGEPVTWRDIAGQEQQSLNQHRNLTAGDLYLPVQEQLEFLRRLQGGAEVPSETDLALRGQQLIDKASRLHDAMQSIDPATWRDPEWTGKRLLQIHNESRARAGEVPESPEDVTPELVQNDFRRWEVELKSIEDEARFHYERMNPDTQHMEYGVGNVLDPAANLRRAGELPQGSYVTKVSDYTSGAFEPSPSPYGVTADRETARHFVNVAHDLVGDLDVVHLTDEQMNLAAAQRGLPADTPSFYDRPTDRIIVRQSDMQGPERNRLLIHELAHPIMESATQTPKLRPVIKRLEEQRLALKDAFDNPEHPQHADVMRLLDGNDHGLDNVHEFFSELWSNPDFASALHAVPTTAKQRARWMTGKRETLLASVLHDIKRGLSNMFFSVSRNRLLNDSTIAGLDLLNRMQEAGRPRPIFRDEPGEPLARPTGGGNPVKGEFLHGSPFEYTGDPHGGARGVVWVTKDPRVAREYAEGSMMGAQRGEGARKPNVRPITVDAKNVFDMRKPEHRAIFDEIRAESRQHEDPDEHVRKAQLTGEGLPSFGTVAEIEPYLRARGFDGMWANEGSQGNSLALFKEPLARPAARRVGGSLPARPAEGFVKDVWEGLTERGKDIAHYVNQEGGMTGMVMKVMNFADLARSADAGTKDDKMRGMQGRVQKVYDVGHETLQRKKEIMEQEDHKQFRALANELRVKSPGHLDAVLDYMDRENYVGAAGSSKLGEGENKWVGDREEPGNRQAHNEHPALERAWNALPESSRKMIKGLRDYYKGRYDAIREATLRDLVHLRGFVEGQHPEATEALMKHITDGRDALSSAETDLLKQHVRGYDGYDKPEADRTPDNKEFRDYLSQMRALPEFKKIAGVYYPMMRRGDYVVEGHAKLDRFAKPFGGEEQDREAGAPPTGHWLFPDKDAANQFVDRMSQDDAPFLKVQQAYETDDGKWRVDVNPMHLNFHSSLRKAREEHDRLRQDPDMDMYELQERRDYGKNAMNPAWATTLMKDMIESTKRTAAYRGLDDTTREILSRQWQDLAVRHLMSTSARSRYLPRSYTSGANKDALDNLMQYGNNTANTLAELEFRPQMRDAIADMDKYERDMRDSKDPELAKWGLRRSQIKNEVHNRLRMRNDHLASPIVTKVLQSVLKLSFLDKLMSPGFLLLNASEPWTIAAPMLAGEHGVKAYGEVAKAYNILGAGKVYGAGVADFIKVFKAGIHGDPQLADTLKLLTDKIKQTGFSDQHSTTAELVEMLENLQKHGYLDRNAGMELEQSLDPRATAAGRALNWLDNMFRQSNVAVENVNRGVAGIAGYRLARMKLAEKVRKGEMTAKEAHEEAMAKAQDIVDKSAGNYGFLNAPALFNHPHLKFAFQFKKYALRMTSNIVRVVAGAARGDPGAMGQLIAMAASQQVISGALGLPTEPLKAVITASNVLGINPYNTDDVERILNEYIAGKVGRDAKDAFLYGLPRLLGTGFGARTGWDTMWTYGTLGNKRDDMATAIGHLAGGAPGGLIAEWAQGSQDMAQGIASYMHGAHTQGQQSMVNGMRNLVPIKVLADAFPALQDYFTGRQKPTGQPFDFSPTVGDTIQRIGGIRTARDLAASQARSAFVRQRDVYNADRTRQLQGYAQASNPAERAAVRSHIMNQWNAGKPDVQRITYGDLQKAATAFERKGKLSPSDLGLAITARTRPFAPNPNVYGFMPSGAR